MWVIAGLGNPGTAYAETRHNMGFLVVERLARRWGIEIEADGPALRVGCGQIAGKRAALVEPQTFMNRSGEALAILGADPEDSLVVVNDDIDLELGQVRVRAAGGSAGHRGVASVIEHFGQSFTRVRVGVGRPPAGVDAAAYVLMPMMEQERAAVYSAAELAADAVECLVADGVEAAMNRFNSRIRPDTVTSSQSNT